VVGGVVGVDDPSEQHPDRSKSETVRPSGYGPELRQENIEPGGRTDRATAGPDPFPAIRKKEGAGFSWACNREKNEAGRSRFLYLLDRRGIPDHSSDFSDTSFFTAQIAVPEEPKDPFSV
jgi:hypothetical protein